MARVLKEEVYTARRNEILDVAQRLIQTKGYEQMTVQDILKELHISKGAFYHYFDSKGALMEALIDRIRMDVDQVLKPIVDDSQLPALEKLRLFFRLSVRWKAAHRDYMLAIMRVWYDDDNALFRQKVFANGLKWISPYLTEITRQGVCEGTMNVPVPEHVGEIVFSLSTGLGDSIARLILEPATGQDNVRCLYDLVNTYSSAIERILGAPQGSLPIADPEDLKIWFVNETPLPENSRISLQEASNGSI